LTGDVCKFASQLREGVEINAIDCLS